LVNPFILPLCTFPTCASTGYRAQPTVVGQRLLCQLIALKAPTAIAVLDILLAVPQGHHRCFSLVAPAKDSVVENSKVRFYMHSLHDCVCSFARVFLLILKPVGPDHHIWPGKLSFHPYNKDQ
jgi:hypothetical protein